MQGFGELYTSYRGSDEVHIRGIYAITSFYHANNGDFSKPFTVKVGMSMAIYHRIQNYALYYPEGFYILGYVFLPLSVDRNRVELLERSIHSCGKKYANEWFIVANKDELTKLLHTGSKGFQDAKVHADMSKRISLPEIYVPMALKDKKVISKIVKEQEETAREQTKLKQRRKKALSKFKPNDLGPAFNTRFGAIKSKNP